MNYNKLKETYKTIVNNGYYNKGAYSIANAIGLKMKILDCEYKEGHFNDNVWRYVFKIRLSKGGKRYTFEFGQSIAEGSNEPTLYDILTCLQKYDVGTFEDFCDIFGYNLDSILERKKAKTIYKAVVKEFQSMQRLFNDDELDLLQVIQ